MKILLVSPEDLRGHSWGGVSTYTTTFAKGLSQLGNDVTVLVPGSVSVSTKVGDLTIVRMQPMPHASNIFTWAIFVMKKWFPQTTEALCWAWTVAFYYRSHGPYDIVEAPEWRCSTLLLSALSKHVVVKVHRGTYCYRQDNSLPFTVDSFVLSILEFVAIILARGITSPTKYLVHYYRFVLAIRSVTQKLPAQVIPHGIYIYSDKKKASKYKRERQILFVGRLERAKGVLTLIRAFQLVLSHTKHIKLTVAGEDAELMILRKSYSCRKYLEDYCSQLNIYPYVQFVGKVSRATLKKYYAQCLFVVVPSVGNESSPYTVIEAFNSNRAVIASNTGGIPEVVHHNRNGVLVPVEEEEYLAQAMIQLMDDDKLRQYYESRNRHDKKKYNIEIAAKRTIDFYQKILKITR